MNYGIDLWGNNNFLIEEGVVKVNHGNKPSLLEITEKIKATDLKGPIILRFPFLIQKQINTLYNTFQKAIKENHYKGKFNAVFPLKVNQYPQVVESIIKCGKDFNYGLEAGSKAELIIAMAITPIGSPITVNGFKDNEMITIGCIAAQMGHNITLTIEGIGELKSIIEIANTTSLKVPNIGIRIRLHHQGESYWSKSSGMDAKFGLTTPELFEAIDLLHKNDYFKYFTMLHFHAGSQIESIKPLKKALREVGNVYAELKKMGAKQLTKINIGGGLAVEYAQHPNKRLINYSLEEFSNDVVFMLKEVMDNKGVEHPDIYTESGRFIVASHAVLVAPVLELFSQDYQEKLLQLKDTNPPLIEELINLNSSLTKKNNIEYLHDALDHLESLLTLFDLGYIDLRDRSNAEILVHQIIKKALYVSKDDETPSLDLETMQVKMQERYLINSSFFQSIPDYWGLKQHFPIMPLDKLDKKPLRAACLWDITCDSDGEISFNPDAPLYLHDVDLNNEEYYLGFFNVGAYQETLGMKHNLFEHPSECTVEFNDIDYEITHIKESNNMFSIIESIGYDSAQIMTTLKNNIAFSQLIREEDISETLQTLEIFLYQNGYLRTTHQETDS
ncbi:MAG: biosynthetic arginine decarboxylase [Gammaproteobacteria bacterium]|nr:biosynthetic arginine decarboxylase [Gammaproteobacteria bacterium]